MRPTPPHRPLRCGHTLAEGRDWPHRHAGRLPRFASHRTRLPLCKPLMGACIMSSPFLFTSFHGGWDLSASVFPQPLPLLEGAAVRAAPHAEATPTRLCCSGSSGGRP